MALLACEAFAGEPRASVRRRPMRARSLAAGTEPEQVGNGLERPGSSAAAMPRST